MSLIQAKCTNCGANLEVENTKDAAICPFCGTPYIVEKAINNYNTVNQISGNIVNVYGNTSADFVIRAGTLEKYNGANAEVVVPDTVTAIGASAFRDCRGLTSVVIPSGVTDIGQYAFNNCSGLTNVTIPGTVKRIGFGAFSNCSSLRSVSILDGVTSIEKLAFSNCTELNSINIPDSVVCIGDEAFGNCEMLNDIKVSINTLQKLCPGFIRFDFQFSSQYGKWSWKAFESSEDDEDSRTVWTDEHSSQWYHELKRQKDDEVQQLNCQLWMEQGKCRYCGGNLVGVFSRSCQRCHKKKDY